MGMTITEAYEILSNGLVNAPSEHEWCVAFKMAIVTMRKYQKIEQAYSAYLETMNPDTLADLISTII